VAASTSPARPRGPATLACHCGFTSDIDGLERHLADAFTPPDRVGLDGQKHALKTP
jgi:hypothetical protein